MDTSHVVNIEYRTCNCSAKHVPKPHKLYRWEFVDGTEVFLCPTTYWNLQSLIEKWESGGHEPPGSVRKHYSEFVQGLAKSYWFS